MKFLHLVFLLVLGLSQFQTTNAQYLRDSTRVIGLSQGSDSDSINLFTHYLSNEQFNISLHPTFNIPQIEVVFDDVSVPLFLDFGNSGDILITNAISSLVDYSVSDTIYTYTPSGEVRGVIESVIFPEVRVLGEKFTNVAGNVANWSIFSTEPINGIVGLNYLAGKCFTLSCRNLKIGVSSKSINQSFPSLSNNAIDLETFAFHPTGVYFKGMVNNINAIVYFDTGKSHTMINSELLPPEMIATDKSGGYYKGEVQLVFGQFQFSIYYPRVKLLRRNINSELPVGIEVGSDVLKFFDVTVDRSGDRNYLFIQN
jgi:hypothetical protein